MDYCRIYSPRTRTLSENYSLMLSFYRLHIRVPPAATEHTQWAAFWPA